MTNIDIEQFVKRGIDYLTRHQEPVVYRTMRGWETISSESSANPAAVELTDTVCGERKLEASVFGEVMKNICGRAISERNAHLKYEYFDHMTDRRGTKMLGAYEDHNWSGTIQLTFPQPS